MAKQVPWNRRILKFFIENTLLTPLEEKIIRSRVEHFMTIKQQAHSYHVSEATVSRCVKSLKLKYDDTQKQFPDELPPRKQTKFEDFLDMN